MTDQFVDGSVIIKNVSGADYWVEELTGFVLANGAEVDLMSRELPFYYLDWESANRLVTDCPTAKLFRDIQAGKIQVVSNKRIRPPKPDRMT